MLFSSNKPNSKQIDYIKRIEEVRYQVLHKFLYEGKMDRATYKAMQLVLKQYEQLAPLLRFYDKFTLAFYLIGFGKRLRKTKFKMLSGLKFMEQYA